MSDRASTRLGRLGRGPLALLVAVATTLAIVAGTTVTWFVVRELTRSDGSLEALVPAGEAGSWHAADPERLVEDAALAPGEPLRVRGADAERSSSWYVQLTASAGAEPAVVSLGAAPVAAVPAGATTSLSLLVRLDADGGFRLETTAPVTVSVATVAWLTDPAERPAEPADDVVDVPVPAPTASAVDDGAPDPGVESAAAPAPTPTASATREPFAPPLVTGAVVERDLAVRPAPGGSVAVPPRVLLDTAAGIGAASPTGPLRFSPLGLGGVPSDGVAAVWLQTVVTGAAAAIALPGADGGAPVPVLATGEQTAASGLVLAALDEDGAVELRPDGEPTAVTAVVVGWLAAAERALDASAIEGGVVAGAAAPEWRAQDDGVEAALPGAAPDGAVALWAVQSTGTGRLGEPDGARTTGTDVAGNASGIVADADGVRLDGDVAVTGLAFLGFLAGGGEGESRIAIDTPASGAEIDLPEVGGVVEIAGTVDPGGAGLRRVEVLVGDRYVGVAEVRFAGDELLWRLRTTAPLGEHSLRAVAVDWTGGTAEAATTFAVRAPSRDDIVVAPDVVVLDAAQRADLRWAGADALAFASASPGRVGDVLVSEAAPEAPGGFLRRILSIEVRDALVVVRTMPASLDSVFTSVSVVRRDIAAGPDLIAASGGSRTAPPASVAIEGTLATFELVGVLDMRQELDPQFRPISTDVSVSFSSKADGRVVSSQEEKSSEAGEGRPQEGYASSVQAVLTVSKKFTLRYNFVLDIGVDWKWFDTRIEVRHFEATVTLDVTDSVALEFSGKAAYDSTNDSGFPEFGEVPLGGPVTFVVAGVPIVLRFAITPDVEFAGSIEAKSILSYRASETLTLGFRYRDGRFSPVAEHSRSREPNPPATYVTANAHLKLGIGLTVRAYETLSVTLGVAPGVALDAEFSVTGDPPVGEGHIELRLTLDVYVEVGLRVFDIELLDWKKSVEVYSRVLWDHDLDYGENGSTQSDAADPGSASAVSSGDGDRPLVLVIDVSGSMSGERIQEAQRTLTEVVVNQPPGAAMGVWTYPGTSSMSCDPGGFQIPVQTFTATGEVLDVIDRLTTGGNTPTGEALQAVADRLRSDGMTGATILLVTDGEPNCNADPCAVAQNLLSQGLDLTVHTVGYGISGTALQQLGCISAATGGTTIDVSDPTALADVVQEFSRAELEVEVAAPQLARIGSAAAIEVVVRNVGARDVTDVEFEVAATGGTGAATIAPGVLSTVGNIPTGGVVRRTVTVTPEIVAAARVAPLRIAVSAWGQNADLVSGTTELPVSDSATVRPGPLLAEDAPDVAVLGDGYAVAPGWGTEGALGPGCTATELRADETAGAVVTACPAAPSAAVLDRSAAGVDAPQAALLGGRSFETVVLSAGAEDVGLSALLERCAREDCAMSDPDLQTAITASQLLDLSDLYRRLSTELGDGEPATVIVTAYPWLFPQTGVVGCAGYTGEEAMLFNTIVGFLNASNQAAVARAAADGVPVLFSEATAGALRPDHTLCDAAAGVVDGALSDDGVRSVADRMLEWSQGAVAPEAPGDTAEEVDANPLRPLFAPPITVRVDAGAAGSAFGGIALQPAQPLRIVGSGYQPGALVVASLTRSSSTILATGFADASGSVALEGAIPRGLVPGSASLRVLSVNAAGESVESIAPLAITSPTPLWVTLLGLASVLAVLAGAALLAAGAIRRRRMGTRMGTGDAAPAMTPGGIP